MGKPSIGPIKLPDNSLSDDPQMMAECFVDSFSSVFVPDTPRNPAANQRCVTVIDDLVVTPDIVHDIIANIDVNSSMGGDGIHPRLLNRLAVDLCLPISIMFNSSLQEGILPHEWLKSIVIPIYKKSVRCDPLNYRPISLTSSTCKVLEKNNC